MSTGNCFDQAIMKNEWNQPARNEWQMLNTDEIIRMYLNDRKKVCTGVHVTEGEATDQWIRISVRSTVKKCAAIVESAPSIEG